MALPDPVNDVLAHFLTEFQPNEKKWKTETYVETFLAKRYSAEVASDMVARFLRPICNLLMDEFENRRKAGELLRFKFLDADGTRVAGIGPVWKSRLTVFQDALNTLTDTEFEALSARVLLLLGCTEAWVTPQSHDQGLDAFGYAPGCGEKVPIEISRQYKLVCLAQAKHYRKTRVGSRDIREFVGSRELAIHEIFSTEDRKYSDLKLPAYGPISMVFITTEELPRTVKLMGRGAGIIVISAQDLAILFQRARIVRGGRRTRREIVLALRRSIGGIPTAN
jgi:hypothetical protein